MRYGTRTMRTARLLSVLLLVCSLNNSLGQSGVKPECAHTAQMDIYSDARVSSETGDLSGFEVALDKNSNGPQRKALLFVYEGSDSEGIPLTATINGEHLVIEGTWVERLTEYPSKKEVVQSHLVRVEAMLTPKMLRGTISIDGLEIANPDKMRLKRARQIWVCK
jgi:hypothetical protein